MNSFCFALNYLNTGFIITDTGYDLNTCSCKLSEVWIWNAHVSDDFDSSFSHTHSSIFYPFSNLLKILHHKNMDLEREEADVIKRKRISKVWFHIPADRHQGVKQYAYQQVPMQLLSQILLNHKIFLQQPIVLACHVIHQDQLLQ